MQQGNTRSADRLPGLIPAYRDLNLAQQKHTGNQKDLMHSFWEQHSSRGQASAMVATHFEASPPQPISQHLQHKGLARGSSESAEKLDTSSSPDQASSEHSQEPGSDLGTVDGAKKTTSRKTEQNRRAQQRYRRRKKVSWHAHVVCPDACYQ